MKKEFIFKTEACTGCRSCELACSFHHRTAFSPSVSSIQIINRPKELGFDISLMVRKEGERLSCDHCKGLEERYCVKYCSPLMKAELIKILEQFQGMM
jgi:Fe-S-cluster-containing hydrogenase component 2